MSDVSDWPNKRPSQWTDEERAHVRQLVHGGIRSAGDGTEQAEFFELPNREEGNA